MPKVVFVILHYLTYEDTIECVKSIKDNVIYENKEFVIVDNASYNDSFDMLKSKFSIEEDIYLIRNSENLGFAQGNNIGYDFAKNKLLANFIVIINNDTIIEDKFFIEKIIENYKESKFDILGPKIISLQDNMLQNPLNSVISDKKDVKRNIIKYTILYIMNITKIELIKKKIAKKKRSEFNEECNKNDEIMYNVPLHGSCLVFSKSYIDKFEFAFYPKTFLYVEEDILYYLAKINKLKIVYFPDSVIYHKEDSSTNSFLEKEDKKRRFVYKNILKSSLEFYKLILKNNELKK